MFLPDGRPAKLWGDFQKGIVKSVDFMTECSPSAAGAFVFLTAATIHASKDLSGAACVVPAGTRLSTHRFSGSGGDAASISSQDLGSRCGYADGFGKDLVAAIGARGPGGGVFA